MESSETPYKELARRLGGRFLRRWPLKGGVSADVQALEMTAPDGSVRRVVVRRHQNHAWKPSEASLVELEYGLLKALASTGLPVPAALRLEANGELLPGPFVVLGFVEGDAEVVPDGLDGALEQMARFLARLHALKPDALPLPALPRRTEPLTELPRYLPQDPVYAPLRRALEEGRLSWQWPSAPSILHGDFWPGNVLWQDGKLAVVIDWEDAALGDPRSDLAGCRLELLWKYGPEAAASFTERYTRIRGHQVDAAALALWELYVASAALKSLGNWGFGPEKEAHMRTLGHRFLADAMVVVKESVSW